MTIEQGELNLAPKLGPEEEWEGHTGQEWDEIAKREEPPKEKTISDEEGTRLFAKIKEVINGNRGIKPPHELTEKPISSADAMDRWQKEEERKLEP